MNKQDESERLAQNAVFDLLCFKQTQDYEVCVNKYWKRKDKCDDILKELQRCQLNLRNPHILQ